MVELVFEVGNKHELVAKPKKTRNGLYMNSHRWTAFVRSVKPNPPMCHFADKVRFGLHETFGVDHIDVRSEAGKNFEISYNGWGTFTVPMTIFWKKKTGLKTLTVDHYLSFEGKGEWR